MSKHTPGPWGVVAYGLHGRMKVTAGSMPVASIASANRDASFNARLIAAAPELLAVLQELEESARYWGEYDVPLGIVDRISAAIAKATGEKA